MGGDYRAILVDDDPSARVLARRSLERTGRFTVVAEAEDSDTAVTAAGMHQPDLTVLERHMPDGDGLAALPSIRRAAPDGTVVVLSGVPQTGDGAAGGDVTGAAAQPWDGLSAHLLDLLERASSAATAVAAAAAAREHLRLPAELTSSHAAREFLRDTLDGWHMPDVVDDAELLTSELVNNAVVHAESALLLSLTLAAERLRVEVTDTGGGVLQQPEAEPTDDSGRGLLLVDALSQSWGTSAGRHGKSVWFELDAAREYAAS